MNKFVVISAFQDKFTKVHYAIGTEYKSDDAERVTFLQEEGFLGDQIQGELEKLEEPKEPEKPEEKPKSKKAKLKPPESPAE
jgi:hypothetical protein